jgi:hypothetical protein
VLGGPLAEEAVEHFLPGGRVHRGRLGEDAVQIEQAGVALVGDTQHTASLRSCGQSWDKQSQQQQRARMALVAPIGRDWHQPGRPSPVALLL